MSYITKYIEVVVNETCYRKAAEMKMGLNNRGAHRTVMVFGCKIMVDLWLWHSHSHIISEVFNLATVWSAVNMVANSCIQPIWI